MAVIIPAILEESYGEVLRKLGRIEGAAPKVQLDICDGVFVQAVTWPYLKKVEGEPLYETSFREMLATVEEMPYWESFEYELDLMVADPRMRTADLLAIGPSRVIFHIETLTDPLLDLEFLRKEVPGLVSFGIAISPGTELASLYPVIDSGLVDSVQCMGISTIGVQGAPIDARVYTNLETLRKKYPTLSISVDGGVSLETGPKLIASGASVLVAGSAVFAGGNPRTNLLQLSTL